MAEATAGGVDAKLVRPSIQRICWLDGIGRGRAPHTAHVAYGSWLRENAEIEFANGNFVSTSINLKNKSAGDGCRDKTIEKTILRAFRARTFSRSQGPKTDVNGMTAVGAKWSFIRKQPHVTDKA